MTAGNEVAIVTRNLYGALVLNAANAMFIDIDFADKGTSSSTGGGFSVGLGQARAQPGRSACGAHHLVGQSAIPMWALRIYRTAAGLRCLITNQTFDPSRSDALDILRAFESDPLYVRLVSRRRTVFARASRPSRGAATWTRRRHAIRGTTPTLRFNIGCGNDATSRPVDRMPSAVVSRLARKRFIPMSRQSRAARSADGR